MRGSRQRLWDRAATGDSQAPGVVQQRRLSCIIGCGDCPPHGTGGCDRQSPQPIYIAEVDVIHQANKLLTTNARANRFFHPRARSGSGLRSPVCGGDTDRRRISASSPRRDWTVAQRGTYDASWSADAVGGRGAPDGPDRSGPSGWLPLGDVPHRGELAPPHSRRPGTGSRPSPCSTTAS